MSQAVSQVDQVTAPSSIQPCLPLYHRAQSEPARQAQQFTDPATQEPLGSLLEQEKCTKHPPHSCQLVRSSMTPGESVLCCHHSKSGEYAFGTSQTVPPSSRSSQLCTCSGRDRTGGLGASDCESCLLFHVLCISNDKGQCWPRARICPSHEVLGVKVTG